MAATFIAIAQGVALPTSASAKTLLQLYNTHATQKLKVTRVWIQPMATTTVTAVFQTLSLGRNTTSQTTGATTVTPVAYDTDSGVSLSVTCNHSPTTSVTLVDTFRQFIYTGDEYVTGVAKFENLMALPSYALIWDIGYGDSTVEPITLNTNEGLSLTSAGVASGVGTVDVSFEFYAV